MKPINKITNVKIKGTDIAKQFIEDKYSRLDVKATTSNNETINIEIQLKREIYEIKILGYNIIRKMSIEFRK